MTSTTDDRRVAIVTGGARGLGAAIARRLAREGRAVAVADLDLSEAESTASSIREAGGIAIGVALDVSREESVADAVAHVAAELGAPTILVNNAGILRDDLLYKMSVDDWDAVIAVHLRGAFLLARAVQVHQVASTWGRTVNISSTSALGNRGQANYSAAKAGLQGFTKTLALELGPFGVTVNSVAPGFIATDMTRAAAERLGMTFEAFLDSIAQSVAVRRAGEPADIAAAVAYFASDEASFVNGQVLYVSGGPAS